MSTLIGYKEESTAGTWLAIYANGDVEVKGTSEYARIGTLVF